MNKLLSGVVRIQKARTTLLLDHPFFGALLFRLAARPRRSIETMATDGVSLFFNPEFVESLNAAELTGVLAHEVLHPALQHHTRRGGRNHKRWNMACDYAINPIVVDAALTLPAGVLIDNRFRGMSAEQIYNLIEQEEAEDVTSSGGISEGSEQNADGSDATGAHGDETHAPKTPGGIGQVLDAPEPQDEEGRFLAEQSREWQIAVEQAENVAKLSGKMPASVVRSLEAAEAANVDWRELLRRAWSDSIPADYTWASSNRRHIWTGLYLPGIRSEGVGEVAIAVDCSGSINERQLGLFESEIRAILSETRPRLVHVLYFDAEIQRTDTYQPGETIKLTPVGGGGTDFRPCFRWLDEHGITPNNLVFLTDLDGTFPKEAPVYPVLWASTDRRRAPFGQVIPIQAA
jgi:predicted metal-dependent peptidase